MANNKSKKELLEELLNSEKEDYDINSDPVFKALKDSVKKSSATAAEDILGKYSQISGGGSVSSAAMSAASQGANKELSRLGEKIPELYALAQEMYNDKLAEKEKKFRSAMDYDAHLAKLEQLYNSEKNEEDNTEIDGAPELPKGDAEVMPDENTEEKMLSKGKNGITTGSLAMNESGKHQMDKNVFTATKRLINTYLSAGQNAQANTLFSKFKNSMSDSQRLEIELLLKGD